MGPRLYTRSPPRCSQVLVVQRHNGKQVVSSILVCKKCSASPYCMRERKAFVSSSTSSLGISLVRNIVEGFYDYRPPYFLLVDRYWENFWCLKFIMNIAPGDISVAHFLLNFSSKISRARASNVKFARDADDVEKWLKQSHSKTVISICFWTRTRVESFSNQ